ncbi:3-hydroxyacyl-CoA dehydrogenase [Oceanobacillus picturae]|uniref:3-hydroxyacyl-CoA dehydrogenase n=1 Tax=Oceanobacillus picturae TaxID=171693 RepID=A0A0U9HFX8_9BACI|nr:hypothetical protein [Oceanobacillus picturae]GAQ18694.1 3-hydroxyacyl-CoA dehydrogenase [Oceanobacillus picturae]
MKNETLTYQLPRTIVITKSGGLLEELSKHLHLKEEFYYVNVFEGPHSLMQLEVTNGSFTKIVNFSGKRATFILSHLYKALGSKTAILEVEVKGAI